MSILTDPTEVKNIIIKCDGSGGPLGHPAIFLNLGKEGKTVCPYCSKAFIKERSLSSVQQKKSRKA